MIDACPRYEDCPTPRAIRGLGLPVEQTYQLLGIACRFLALTECTGYDPAQPSVCNNASSQNGEVTAALVEIGAKMDSANQAYDLLYERLRLAEKAHADAEKQEAVDIAGRVDDCSWVSSEQASEYT